MLTNNNWKYIEDTGNNIEHEVKKYWDDMVKRKDFELSQTDIVRISYEDDNYNYDCSLDIEWINNNAKKCKELYLVLYVMDKKNKYM